MKMKREGFKGLHVENQFFHDVKYLVASMSKYQVFVQFFSFATIAIKNIEVFELNMLRLRWMNLELQHWLGISTLH